MSTPITEQKILTVNPGRGVAVDSRLDATSRPQRGDRPLDFRARRSRRDAARSRQSRRSRGAVVDQGLEPEFPALRGNLVCRCYPGDSSLGSRSGGPGCVLVWSVGGAVPGPGLCVFPVIGGKKHRSQLDRLPAGRGRKDQARVGFCPAKYQ